MTNKNKDPENSSVVNKHVYFSLKGTYLGVL